MIPTALIYHPDCELHDMGEDHPESPLRTKAIMQRLQDKGLFEQLKVHQAKMGTSDHVLKIHHATYVEQLERINPSHGLIQADPDTLMGPHSYDASYLAVGAGVQAVDGVLSGQYKRAFCNIRPPGHHAEPAATMGFCFFNNIAVAVAHALEQEGINKVAILDFDVHQCNGTIEAFADKPEVMVCTSFQHPFYPNSHWASEHPHMILTPLVAFSDIRDMKHAWEAQWLPELERHQPDMIFISAGFDAHTLDTMGQLNWQNEDYYWLTKQITEFAATHCDDRIISMLEGGYHLPSLAESASLHIQALLED
ncbi:histone deacetylase family protein [Reinekea marina]|uniref:Histone deacetylase family protein n=1 Tax=Reinekea marina TaxID=1310421 RepID=A0ABV7WQF5_9GAMM|nr:histone deacetylase family protein [Reinekea marina]MDN3650298.1 histone deacetylase family protein [Reinekea marina]MDN3651090.1 histone deacetylase family protein [Reinekea marina]